jgi:hypothetical protein
MRRRDFDQAPSFRDEKPERVRLAGDVAAAGFASVRTVTAARVLKEAKGSGIREFTVFLMTGRKPGDKEGTP